MPDKPTKTDLPPVDGKVRCEWCDTDPQYVRYHDREWSVPAHEELRDHSQPAEDRSGDSERAGVSRRSERVRQLRPVCLEIRRRQADPEPPRTHLRCTRQI